MTVEDISFGIGLGFGGLVCLILLTALLILFLILFLMKREKTTCEHDWITIPIEIEGTFHPTIFTLIFGGLYHGKVKVELPKCRKCNKQIEPDTWGWL
jgi:hypothetical protein